MRTFQFFISLLFLIDISIEADTVLLTGGAGFIGSHTAHELAKNGHRVIIVDYLENSEEECSCYILMKKYHLGLLLEEFQKELQFYQVDILNREALESIFLKEKPQKVIHIAASAGVRNSIDQPASYLVNNIIGTLNVLELAHQYHIEHVVIASSSSVYGECQNGPFKEDQITDTQCSPYAVSKKSIELLAYNYHHLYHLPCTCLRFFTVYGPWGRLDMAPFIFLNAMHRGETIEVFGDGSAIRDFTYVDDVVRGVLLALEKPFGFEVFNIGCGQPIDLNSFISTLEKVTGNRAKVSYKPTFSGDVSKTHADITKAKKLLGYEPQISIEKGMEMIYSWYLQVYLPLIEKR